MNRRFSFCILFAFGCVLLFELTLAGSFLNQQNRYSRVRNARQAKAEIIQARFDSAKIEYPPHRIFIRAFKQERQLELWARDGDSLSYALVATYPFTAFSGELGPKRRQGDGQIPEGFYHIDGFNPTSQYHLSLRLNYPNESDRILGYRPNLGGDIFIHGDQVTIGCIPVGDEAIKELYVMAVDVTDQGQKNIPVAIFPCKLDSTGQQQLAAPAQQHPELLDFWLNLREGYEFFERHARIPRILVEKNGKYVFYK